MTVPRVEATLFKADYLSAGKTHLDIFPFLKAFEYAFNLFGEISQIDYSPLRVAL